jgi:hypothetical protein
VVNSLFYFEAPARQSAALPHTAVLNTSGSCFAVFDHPIGRQQDRSPSSQFPPILTRWKASIAGYRASVRIILVLFHRGSCILNIRTRKRRACGCGSLE